MVTAVVLVVVVTIMLSVKYSRIAITLIVKEMGAVIKDLIMEG